MFKHISLVVCSLVLVACGGGGEGGARQAALPAGAAIISTQGGTVSLQNVATVTVPPGAFTQNTTVQVTQSPKSTYDTQLDVDGAMLGIVSYLPTAVKVTADSAQPSGSISVSIPIPASFAGLKPPNTAVRVLAASRAGSSLDGSRDYFDLIQPTLDTAGTTLSFSADPTFFSRDESGKKYGVFLVVLAPSP